MRNNIIRSLVLMSFVLTNAVLYSQNDNENNGTSNRSIGKVEFETPDLNFTIGNDDPYTPGFVGEDKSVFLAPDKDYVEVEIGTTDSRNNVYYKWEVVDKPMFSEVIFDDVYSCRTTVRLNKTGEYILRCIQMSKYGRKSECVSINVTSKVELLAVRRKDICYYNGSTILKHDFEYETNPSGLEDYVNILPPDVIYGQNIDRLWPMFVHDVEFETMDEDGEYKKSDVKCKLPVVDDETRVMYSNVKARLDSGKPFPTVVEENVEPMKGAIGAMSRMFCLSNPNYMLPPVFDEIILIGEEGPSLVRLAKTGSSVLNNGMEALGFLKSVTEKFEMFGGLPNPLPIEMEVESEFENMGFRMDCNEGDIIPKIYYQGIYSATISFSKDFDIPYLSIPKIGGCYAELDIGLNAKFENDDITKELNPTADKLAIPIDIKLVGGGTVGVRAFSPDVLSVNVKLGIELKTDVDINFSTMIKEEYCSDCWDLADDPFETKSFNAKLFFNVRRTFLGLNFTDESYNVLEYNSINGLNSDLLDIF